MTPPAAERLPLRFGVLGPLCAWRDGRVVDLGAPQQQTVLAVLLLHAGRPVARERLIAGIWADTPPPSVVNLVHRHVSGLRKALALDRRDPTIPSLTWTDAGYLITLPPESLDLSQFTLLLKQARTARSTGEPAAAAEALRAAVRLWRGTPFAGLPGPLLAAHRDQLTEQYVDTIEERVELDLMAGGGGAVVAELREAVSEHPLRERLHALLMWALYQDGRQADALAVFHETRRLLDRELGVRPSAFLQHIHQRILNGDPDLAAPRPDRGLSARPADIPRPDRYRKPIPAQLPHDIPDLAGRDHELRTLDALLADPVNGPAAAVTIVIIDGTAGVGKTSLAVYWAHRIRDRFPDGQLYVNLRGFDLKQAPTPPAEAIRAVLDALAVPPEQIPEGLDGQATLYRSILAGRQMLILLDNAHDPAQIRPLLPGTPGCVVIVTTRRQLVSLVTVDGAHPLTIGLLSAHAARQLLRYRVGDARVAGEPAAVDEIIASCARLPLALSIVAARAAMRPDRPLSAVAAALREATGSLDPFDGGDQSTDIRSVFSWSYQAVSEPAARMFRLLGLPAGPEISTLAAASLAGTTPTTARRLLAELVGANLVTELGTGRHTLHDLLRIYADEQSRATESAAGRSEAFARLFDHYLHTAAQADRAVRPCREDMVTLPPARPQVVIENPIDHQHALAWFTTEYPVLLSILRQAEAEGYDRHVWQLGWALTSFLDRRGRWNDAVEIQGAALAAAGRLGDPYAQAVSHCCLAYAHVPLGHYNDAQHHLNRSLQRYESISDLVGQAYSHRCLTWVMDRRGDYQDAIPHAWRAVELFGRAGHQTGQAKALSGVGWFHIQLGEYREGLVHCQHALDLQRTADDQFGQADTLHSIGFAHRCLGHHEAAISRYQQAVLLYRELSHRYYEAGVLSALAGTYHDAHRSAEARTAWSQALVIFDDLGHPDAAAIRDKLAMFPTPDQIPASLDHMRTIGGTTCDDHEECAGHQSAEQRRSPPTAGRAGSG